MTLKTASINSAQCDQNSTSSHLHVFWLQSKTWTLFHSTCNLSATKLSNIHPIILNVTSISPYRVSSVSHFDVIRNCASCEKNVTYSFVLVDGESEKIILVELDAQFQVISLEIIIEASNIGQVSFTYFPQPSITWIEDSSCLRRVPLKQADRLTTASKLFCMDQFSSESVVSAFHEGENGEFTYVLSNRGDVLRFPSLDSLAPSSQLLISSDLYTKEDIHEQHATTFNSIHVVEKSTPQLSIFLSVKDTGVILRLEMNCLSPKSQYPCHLTSSQTILAEHHLFDFQLVVGGLKYCASWSEGHFNQVLCEGRAP